MKRLTFLTTLMTSGLAAATSMLSGAFIPRNNTNPNPILSDHQFAKFVDQKGFLNKGLLTDFLFQRLAKEHGKEPVQKNAFSALTTSDETLSIELKGASDLTWVHLVKITRTDFGPSTTLRVSKKPPQQLTLSNFCLLTDTKPVISCHDGSRLKGLWTDKEVIITDYHPVQVLQLALAYLDATIRAKQLCEAKLC